jgi:hypothetical protein
MKIIRLYRILPSLLLALLVASCSRDTGRTHGFEVTQESGLRRAVNTGGPRYEGELFAYERVVTLQENPQDPESLLDEPAWFVMDEQGGFYLNHNHDRRIQVFAPDGTYRRSFGHYGEGPGEFKMPRFQDLRGDTLSLFDPPLQRTTRYRTDGTLLDVFRPPANTEYLDSLHEVWPGTFLAIGSTGVTEKMEFREGIAFVTFSQSGDTLGESRTETVAVGYVVDSSGPIRQSMPYTFAPSPSALVDREGGRVLLTSGDEPIVRWYGLDGACREEIRVTDRLEPLNLRTLKADLARMVEHSWLSEGRADTLRRGFGSLRLRDHKGFSVRVFADRGFLWLMKPVVPWTSPPPVCCVISPEGEYLGDSTWPVAVHWNYARVMRGYFLGLTRDPASGAQLAVVYRIRPRVEDLSYPPGD